MKEYYENPAISQSSLKKLAISPKKFLDSVELESKSLMMGSAVDCMLLTPKEFEKSFLIIENDLPTPPAAVVTILKQIVSRHIEGAFFNSKGLILSSQNMNIILDICNEFKYRMNNNDNTRVTKVIEHSEYLRYLYKSQGRKTITSDDLFNIQEIVLSLEEHEFTSHHFNCDDDAEYLIQIPIYFEVDGIKLKALPDLVRVDHINKRVTPKDLKTMSGYTNEFIRKNFWKYRYDLQAAFYTEAVQHLYPDYEIDPFEFIVESTIAPGSPLTYVVTPEVLEIGTNGGIHNGREYKGWKQCLEELKWHREHNIWDYTREEYENKGVMPITVTYGVQSN